MAQFLNNGRVRFDNNDFKTSEVIILRSHISKLIADRTYEEAYECLIQLNELLDTYEQPAPIVSAGAIELAPTS